MIAYGQLAGMEGKIISRRSKHEVVVALESLGLQMVLQVDPAIQNCVLTVRFENQNLDAVLTVLQSTLELTITKKNGKTYITGKGC